MKKWKENRFLAVILMVTMVITMMPMNVFADEGALEEIAAPTNMQTVQENDNQIQGSGTAEDPYLIENGIQLESLGGQSLSGYYRITADMDMSGIEMRPISNFSNGLFDGGGFVISNLTISASNNTGLFAQLGSGANLQSIILEDCTIINTSGGGSNGVGALVGKVNMDATISDCGVGGNSQISSSATNYTNVGGLIGLIDYTCTVQGCFAKVSLTGGNYYSNRNNYTGGLIGRINDYQAVISDCYVIGAINARYSCAGGLVGGIYGSGKTQEFKNCYAVTTIEGEKEDYHYGFGYCNSSYSSNVIFTNCYYDRDRNGKPSTNHNSADVIMGKTDGEMASLAPELGASFQTGTEGYPILKWEDPNATYGITLTVIPADGVLIFDGTVQPANEEGIYTFPGLESGSEHTYTASQRDETTDFAPKSGTIIIGKKDVAQTIELEENRYDMTFTMTQQGVELVVKDEDGHVLTPQNMDGGKVVYQVVNGSYTYFASGFGYEGKEGTVAVDRDAVEEAVALKQTPAHMVTFRYGQLIDNQDIENGSLTVTTGERQIQPETDGLTYRLPVGYDYTYSFKSANYAKVNGEIGLSEADTDGSQTIVIPLTVKTAWGGSDDVMEPALNEDGVYEIGTGAQLAWLAQKVNSSSNLEVKAVLTRDIDLGDEEWTPIGTSTNHGFKGTLDGKGHTITGLSISLASGSGSGKGLFGYINGGAVKNLTVKGSIQVSADYVGGIAGCINGSDVIQNCASYVEVSGNNRVGGIVGNINTSSPKQIDGCANYGAVSGTNQVGGLVGYMYYAGTVSNSYNSGQIAGTRYVGGITGWMNDSKAVVQNCYTVGTVTGGQNTAPAIGQKSSGAVTNLYNLDTNGNDPNSTAKTEEELKSAEFVALLGEPFISDMKLPINDGYPILSWQDTNPRYMVTLAVEPADAQVVLKDETGTPVAASSQENGNYIWSLVAGDYTYTVSSFGKETKKGVMHVTPETGVEGIHETIILEDAANYSVSFMITPAEANPVITLMYQGKILGTETPGTWQLPAGEYTYTVKAKGYGKETGGFTVTDEGLTLPVALTETQGWDGETIEEPNLVDDVYQIASGEELAWFAQQVNEGPGKNYDAVLTDDVNLGGHLWTPIGRSYSYRYAGSFDGGEHQISGLKVECGNGYGGLFGYVEGSSASHAKIANLTVEGTVTNTYGYLGGIVGRGSYVDVLNCHSLAAVVLEETTTGRYIGGIIGQIENGAVENCSNHGQVGGAKGTYVGGIIGYNDGNLTGCYNGGLVSGASDIGGVIGFLTGYKSKASDIYNVGEISGSVNVGGLIGKAYANVEKGYAAGQVTGGKGAFGTFSSGYTITGIYCLNTLPADEKATVLAEADLKNLTDTLNDGRETPVWKSAASMNQGYPILAWQKVSASEEPVYLEAVQDINWESYVETYIDPEENQQYDVMIHRPVVRWDKVAHAETYTATLWKQGFTWNELTEEESAAFYGNGLNVRQKLMLIDENEIVAAMTEAELAVYENLYEAVLEAVQKDGDSEATENARAEYLIGIATDGNHQVRLGYHVPTVGKVKDVTGITENSWDFGADINEQGEGRYYVTVTPVAKEDSDYLTPEPLVLDHDSAADLDAANQDACYNHLRQPYNLRWDGTVAKWACDSKEADFCSITLYEVTGSKEAPVYTVVTHELLQAGATGADFGRYFTADKRYAFAVRAEAGEAGMIAGYSMSPRSVYSSEFVVGNPQIPGEDTDRSDWIAISSAKEWIDLANVEDISVSQEDKTSQQTIAWGKKYYLTADIDFSNLSAADQTKTKSIGNVTNRFMGVMDGNGHRIKGLTLSNNDAGLFAYIGATGLVYDITVENANVLFSDNAAVMALNNFGTIAECGVINCNITADTGAVLGGMVSRNYGKIRDSYVEGGSLTSNALSATGHAGFVGANEEGAFIERCWTSMDVNTGSEYAGGFLGLGYGGTIKDCFALGDVSARSYSGGFVGSSVFDGNVYENCYAAGKVTVSSGLEGHGFISPRKPDSAFQTDITKEVKNCYYNAASLDDDYAAAKSQAEMKESGFLRLLDNNRGVWVQDSEKNDGMPYLAAVKAPQKTETKEITVEIALATYDKEAYGFSQLGDVISVTLESDGNTRIVDVLDAAMAQDKLTYSYQTTSAFGRYIHMINGYAVEPPDGWMFTVNDQLSNVSASLAVVKDGDRILWYEGATENLFKGPTWGSITEGETIQWVDIENLSQLKALADSRDKETLAKNYRLTCDLDMSGVEFPGIGSVSMPFTGMFDGQGHTVSYVTMTGNGSGTGFFNAIQGAVVKNLHLTDVNITGENQVGGLVGMAKAQLDQEDMAKNEANLIGNCTVTGTVTATGHEPGCVGGLVGQNCKDYDKDTLFTIASAIDKCKADVTVTGRYKAGGLVGENGGAITQSGATGTVTSEGGAITGGFVGDNTGDIYDCYGTGHVIGGNHTGGFVGYSDGTVKNCYSLGNVSGVDYTGGFAGGISKGDFVISAGKVVVIGQPTQGYNAGFAGELGGALTGVENQITIKNVYGNCVGEEGILNVVGNSSKFTADTVKEKLAEMTLSTRKEVADQLYEMFGIQLPTPDLEQEAVKYESIAIGSDVEAGRKLSLMKEGETEAADIQVTYTVDNDFAAYMEGGSHLILKKANDTAATIYVPVRVKLTDADGVSYTKELSVALCVGDKQREDLLDAIAATYEKVSDSWTVMDMVVYQSLAGKTIKTDEKTLQNALNLMIGEAADSKSTASDRARLEIVLRAMGIDSAKLYEANSLKAIDNSKNLTSMDLLSGGYYSAPWILLSELEGNVKLTDIQRDSLIGVLKENAGDGLFGYEWGGVTYTDVDTAAVTLAALAPYYDANDDAKTLVDLIVKGLRGSQDEKGSFGSANSDAMVIIGLLAKGENPFTWQASSGVSVVDGLLSYVNPKTQQFTFGGSDNALATEQAFRALVALAKYDGQTAYNIYDFSQTVVVPGHATGQGAVDVPPAPGDDKDTIKVTVSIEAPSGIWMDRKTVEVKEGSTVYHAFVKALEGSGITQTGAEKGYVKSMTRGGVTLAELGAGPNSGWLYKVNDNLPEVGLTSYQIQGGDHILWYYTADYVNDPSAGGIITDIPEPDVPLDQPEEPGDEAIKALIKGVEGTKITLRSKFSKAGKIQLNWIKSKGYKVDYYEVYRSVKRYEGYGKKPFFTTKDLGKASSKCWYINTKSLKKGTRYYYKVRGVRVINGKKYYTQWSNKAWRIAR